MKLVQKRSRKTGLPPGTLVHIGEIKTDKVTITAQLHRYPLRRTPGFVARCACATDR
jgi:hypothetical protein